MEFPRETLVIATHNAGKLREISALFTGVVREVKSAADFDLPSPEETETTFEGNALLKARFVAEATGLPALSDDSGLEVDALGGAPGVYTADWAETPDGRDFPMAMEKVWQKLEACNAPAPRTARFVCVLCMAWPGGDSAVWRGEVAGQIVWPMRGAQGFGFDPVFLPNGERETFGEMDPARKHRMSHRAEAFAKLLADVHGH